MNELPWTDSEVQTALMMSRDGKSAAEIGDYLKRSKDSVQKKLKRSKPVEADETEHVAYWKREAGRLQAELKRKEHEGTAVNILVEQVAELAPRSYVPPKAIRYVRTTRDAGSPQSAVLMLSDTHIGQVVEPDQTLGAGNYNFELFLRRLARLERSIYSIVQDHTTTQLSEIVVAMLGDMIHGNLAHAVEAGQHNTLFTQFYAAGHAIAQFINNLSALAPIRINCVVGNHPRWGTQKKMPTDNRYSNLDQFLYAYIQALLKDNKRVTMVLDKQPFALFDVQGWHFYAGHGDHMKGGDKMLGIPNHAVGRNISMTTQLFAKLGKPAPNYYLFGHFHREITLPHALGEIIINGGFPGLDGFGLMSAFNPADPSQKFFLVHPKFGRSATYDLKIGMGDKTPHSYALPESFQCL